MVLETVLLVLVQEFRMSPLFFESCRTSNDLLNELVAKHAPPEKNHTIRCTDEVEIVENLLTTVTAAARRAP